MDDTPQDNPVRKLAVDVPAMCEMLGVGLSTGWSLVTKPDPDHPDPDHPDRPAIESIAIGRRRLPLVESIHAYVERKRSKRFGKVANPPLGKGRKPRRGNQETSQTA